VSVRLLSTRSTVGLCAGLVVMLSGCASEPEPDVAPPAAPLTATEQRALVDHLVGAEELPPMRRTSDTLTREDIVAEADLPDLGATLDTAGFRGGLKREYRGESRQLTGVESQVLAFSSSVGARAFNTYLSKHAGAFFGEPTGVQRFTVDGRDGWLFDPPLCGCAGAQPLGAGAVQVASEVLVLQITGPRADSHLLRILLRGAAS